MCLDTRIGPFILAMMRVLLVRALVLFLSVKGAIGKDRSKFLDLYAQILMIKPPATPEVRDERAD